MSELTKNNPTYPRLNAEVVKWRARAAGGLKTLTREERRAYGEAVGAAILALQRSEALRRKKLRYRNCICVDRHRSRAINFTRAEKE